MALRELANPLQTGKMVPSIEKSLDLDDMGEKGKGGITAAPTSKGTQDTIIDSAGIQPLGSGGAVGKSSDSKTGSTGYHSTTKSSLSRDVDSEIKPHTSTTTGSASGAVGSRGPKLSTKTTTTTRSSGNTGNTSNSSNSSKPSTDDPIWKKLAVVGAIALAGVVAVAGVRKAKDEKPARREPEKGFEKLKRKTQESAHDAKHNTGHAAGNIGDSVSGLGHKISHAAGDIKHQVVGAGEDLEHKAEHKAEQAKKEAEKAKQDAKDRMEAENKKNQEKARLDAIAEQKRMTYGQDGKGHPKKALDDTGDGFLNYKSWWPWAKKDL